MPSCRLNIIAAYRSDTHLLRRPTRKRFKAAVTTTSVQLMAIALRSFSGLLPFQKALRLQVATTLLLLGLYGSFTRLA